MPHYILHIGPHKTGTTYLQAGFADLRERLAGHKILYPEIWQSEKGSGHLLLFTQLRENAATTLEAQFRSVNASGNRIILISSEDLSDLVPSEIELLKALIEPHPATIIFYCRDWIGRMISGWKEGLRHGSTQTLPEFMINHNLGKPTVSNSINLGVVLDRYTAAFSLQRIRLVPYNRLIEENVDLLRHFLKVFLDIEISDSVSRPRLNVSPSDIEAEIARALNLINPIAGLRYLDGLPKIAARAIKDILHNYIRTLEVNEADPIFAKLHEALFAKYGHCFVDPKPNSMFFSMAARKVRYISSDYLVKLEAHAAITELKDELQIHEPNPEGNLRALDLVCRRCGGALAVVGGLHDSTLSRTDRRNGIECAECVSCGVIRCRLTAPVEERTFRGWHPIERHGNVLFRWTAAEKVSWAAAFRSISLYQLDIEIPVVQAIEPSYLSRCKVSCGGSSVLARFSDGALSATLEVQSAERPFLEFNLQSPPLKRPCDLKESSDARWLGVAVRVALSEAS